MIGEIHVFGNLNATFYGLLFRKHFFPRSFYRVSDSDGISEGSTVPVVPFPQEREKASSSFNL